MTCSNFAALAKNSRVDNLADLAFKDAELIITVSGEVSVLHKNSHLVVKEVLPQIEISTKRCLVV